MIEGVLNVSRSSDFEEILIVSIAAIDSKTIKDALSNSKKN